LFELLCTARTRAGEETLAGWLSEPASCATILERQEAVQELRSYIDFREDLSVLGPEVRSAMRPEFMAAWARRPQRLPSNGGRIALCLVLPALASLIAYEFFDGSIWVMLLCVGMESFFGLLLRSRVRVVLDALDEPVKELKILGLALRRVEQEKFSSSRLRRLQEALETSSGQRRPSEEIARLVRLYGYLEQRRNQFFAFFAPLLLWSTQFAFAIENWRRRSGPEIELWLAHFGEFEALCALSGYAYEHPEDPFPDIVEGEVVLEGTGMRHPLIPRHACVANSIRLGQGLQLLLVSGSNMSGKSTLLRTVGINTVLALAGGPVRAEKMRVCPVAIGATLRVQDSLQAGVSRFYAEIQRLHSIMELAAGTLPALFLLDEILHGTNSHDRGIGAEAVVRGLVERGAIGLVTTHDLVLTKVAESLAPRALNVHFQDHLENGRMTFDYVLHPGVVQKSNALELMRAVGLRV
jgi:DNA mismatch repair ATPase MutS